MVTVRDYPEDAVAAARAVLLEVLTVLGAYRDAMVLVGGWVPPLSFPDAGHVGSLDIDLALDETKGRLRHPLLPARAPIKGTTVRKDTIHEIEVLVETLEELLVELRAGE